MQVTGIIVEYNPFHNGHQYHVEQARQRTNAEVIVAVMSGNFVQRGKPAIFDKWTRAREALCGGVDVVFELPISGSVQPGHIFAQEAVKLLHEVGVQTIVCGAEHPDYDFMKLAQQPIINKQAFKAYQQTYATTYYEQLTNATGVKISLPNDILALSYAHAIVENNWQDEITLQPIQRIGANYHDQILKDNQVIASATAIRENDINKVKQYVPTQTYQDLTNISQTASFEKVWWPFLKYRIESASISELSRIYQVTEGLEYKLKKAVEQSESYEDLIHNLKSKRYTSARLQRMVLYVLLNISDAEMQMAWNQPFLNLLGVSTQGQKWLKKAKKSFTIPFYSRIGYQARMNEFAVQYKADQIFSNLGQQPNQNIGRIPWH